MKSASLPTSFRSMAHACAATNVKTTPEIMTTYPEFAVDLERRREIVNRVCDRAKRLSDRGKLTGKDEDEIAEQLYGSSFLWLLWLWKYRALIWQVIRLLAELANRSRYLKTLPSGIVIDTRPVDPQ